MSLRDDDIRVRPGRVRSRGDRAGKRFVNQVLTAAQKAGGVASRSATTSSSSAFGRGRSASLRATRGLASRTRRVTIKARVVRQAAGGSRLAAHLDYIQRDGVTRDGAAGRLFGAEQDVVDGRDFAERCADDRHHFRFIVSPQDGAELADLKAFTRDLMASAEPDLGTRLDWVAVEHHNTEHPHVHVLVRGRADDGQDLVISRDYIREGFRARAQALVTLELGPRTDLEIRRGLEAQVGADRWTDLDRGISRAAAAAGGVVDLRPDASERLYAADHARLGRMRKLEQLGLATPIGPAQWALNPGAETTLRDLGERGDIIKRLHRAMSGRTTADWVVSGEAGDQPIVGRLVERGLHDELSGSAFAVVDGVDGRAHHLKLSSLEATGDARPGAVVELRRFADAGGKARLALAVRSDLAIEAQVTANGATWLDRRLIARETAPIADAGFGRDVQAAMERRTDYLVAEGLARRQGQRVVFAEGLLGTLRDREIGAAVQRLAAETGLTSRPLTEGDSVSGVYCRRITLASGRFAMIDNGLGFSLAPWTPGLERQLGREVSGKATATGVDWSFTRRRGLGVSL